MRRSHIAHAHSTVFHPQTNGLVERQNRTLVNMIRVYCSRYLTDWDKYLPQVVGAYNSNGDQPFHNVDRWRERERERESNAPELLLSGV